MLSKIRNFILLAFLFIMVANCGKKEDETNDSDVNNQPLEKIIPSDDTINKEKSDTTSKNIISTEEASKLESTVKPQLKEVVVPANFKIYHNLKRLLASIKVGETQTKEDLIASGKVPNDALKIVKSVTKVSENELSVKWKSTWLVEKVSDVKLNDDKIKIRFKNDLVYTSGNAIGIKYDGKIYNDLIIKGDRAYIPTVKQYTWKIGKK